LGAGLVALKLAGGFVERQRMLNKGRANYAQNRWAVVAALLALWLLAGCAVDVSERAARLPSPLPPTVQEFRFPTPTFTPPAAATPEAAASTPAMTPPAAPTQAPTVAATVAPTVAATATPDAPPTPYRFATLNGDLLADYPAALPGERFTLHYDPAAPPAIVADALAALISQTLTHHEQLLGVTLAGHFDVYAAGALFAAPDQALRGHSFSRLRYFQVVVDNNITNAVQRYIVAHELTHLFAWNTFGVPSSVMLSEGLAVYAGLHFVGDELLALHDFCAAYAQAGALSRVATDLAYQGHIRNLEHYYAAGCFVQFLLEQYGVAAFARLYPTGDYVGIYGRSLAELEAEWLVATTAHTLPASLDPMALTTAVAETKRAYLDLLVNFDGRPEQVAAYRWLDAQWGAVLAGQFPAGNSNEEGAEHE
jgi:hypothetical protein